MPRRAAPAKPKPALQSPPQGEGAAWFGARIPRPPSLNRLYRIGKSKTTGKRTIIPSAAYSSWIAQVHWATRGLLPKATITGPYELVIMVGRRKGSDLDNCAKALCDWLKQSAKGVGVVEDDSLCELLTLKWSDDLNAKEAAFFVRSVVRAPKPEAPKRAR